MVPRHVTLSEPSRQDIADKIGSRLAVPEPEPSTLAPTTPSPSERTPEAGGAASVSPGTGAGPAARGASRPPRRPLKDKEVQAFRQERRPRHRPLPWAEERQQRPLLGTGSLPRRSRTRRRCYGSGRHRQDR